MDAATVHPFLYTPVEVPIPHERSSTPYNAHENLRRHRQSIQLGRFTTPQNPLRRPRVYWPIIVIGGQLCFLLFAWVFFAMTSGNNEVVLPDSAAKYILTLPKQVTFTITLLSTVISYVVGFLWARAICYALSMALSQPVSLFAISTSITASAGSPVFNLLRPTWTIAAAITALAFTTQSAGWATLLTPQVVQRDTRISGFELDFSIPAVHDLMVERADVSPDVFTFIIPAITASGVASATAKNGHPTLLNFNQMTFLNSTGGILPSSIVDFPSELAEGETLPASITRAVEINSPDGFETNYTLIQQGFTANVSCEKRELSLDTVPAVDYIITNDTLFDDETLYFKINVTLLCPGANTTISQSQLMQYGEGGISTMLVLLCLNVATDAYDALIVGTGFYGFIETRICHVQPQTTTVEVRYSGSSDLFNGTSAPTFVTVLPPHNVTNLPFPGGLRMISILPRLMRFGQLYDGNTIGDSLTIFLNGFSEEREVDTILEAYLRGMIEFGGTIFRAAFTQTNNGVYENNSSAIPEEMRTPLLGTYVTRTMGWHQDRSDVPGILLAPTFITFMSILITIVAIVKTKPFLRVDGQDFFDATNILHVTAAATAGGMPVGTFPNFDDDGNRHALRTRVRIGLVDGGDGRIGFVPSQGVPELEKRENPGSP